MNLKSNSCSKFSWNKARMSLLFSVLLVRWNWLLSGGYPPGYGPVHAFNPFLHGTMFTDRLTTDYFQWATASCSLFECLLWTKVFDPCSHVFLFIIVPPATYRVND